jgi:hypothetical protein
VPHEDFSCYVVALAHGPLSPAYPNGAKMAGFTPDLDAHRRDVSLIS